MAEYQLSTVAQGDLLAIARYTIRQFGPGQAQSYREGFKSTFALIADNPKMGHARDDVRLGLRCFEYKSHGVYYIETDAGVLIVRILHERQDPARHLE